MLFAFQSKMKASCNLGVLATFLDKGDLISEDVFTKGAKSLYWPDLLNKLFSFFGGKLKFSAQESDLAPFVCNGTKAKIPSEIKPPLGLMLCTYCVVCTVVCNAFTIGRLALSFSLYFPLSPIGRKKVIKHKKK